MINRQKVLLWFYLATPVFFLLDILFQWDVRVSFLDDNIGWKTLYYIFCFGIGYMMWKIPSLEYVFGIIEGGVNMLLLTLSVMLPYYAAIDAISSGSEVSNPLNTFSVINYIISGIFLLISIELRKKNTTDL